MRWHSLIRFRYSSRWRIQISSLPCVFSLPAPETNADLALQHLSCGLLSWSQYSLLSAPRHILTTRFHLTSPLIPGLFYLAPAGGFILGTVIGGRYSDLTVRKWIAKRGERLPQDRLRSGMLAFFFIIPVASLIYGWGLQCDSCSTAKAGLALPIVTSFFMAVGLLAAFASLNTYCAGTSRGIDSLERVLMQVQRRYQRSARKLSQGST